MLCYGRVRYALLRQGEICFVIMACFLSDKMCHERKHFLFYLFIQTFYVKDLLVLISQ